MKVTMISNYLTHHQIPFCNAMVAQKDIEFYFVSTMEMEEERVNGGWEFSDEYLFELKSYVNKESEKKAYELMRKSDVVIIGSAPESYIQERMKSSNNLTFRYSERLYKNGRWRVISPRGFLLRCKTFFRYYKKPLYMLCASSYTAGDLAMLGSYLGRCYKWGYFPSARQYDDIRQILEEKESTTIVWAARFLEWKHPEIAVELARRLKQAGVQFSLIMIGDGPLYKKIAFMIKQEKLEKYIKLTGSINEKEVRGYMEKAAVFLATSDFHEGWGAVINEAMNSGCAILASAAMGATNYLIEHGKNGYVYQIKKYGIEGVYRYLKKLLLEEEKRKEMGKNAYYTIIKEWNAENAAKKFIFICKELQQNKKMFYNSGVCSKAEIDFLPHKSSK